MFSSLTRVQQRTLIEEVFFKMKTTYCIIINRTEIGKKNNIEVRIKSPTDAAAV